MIKNLKLKIKNLPILLVFIFALGLRLYGLNWDQGQYLHPDERFLTMVTADIKLPSSVSQYFDTPNSPLNPSNYPAYRFFVYGTFPIFLTKFFATIFSLDSYDSIHLVGRTLSAFFDSFNIFLLYFLALKIIGKKSKFIYLPSLIYSFCVLPIQLSHFYTVDTFLSTFILATFVLLVYDKLLLSSITFGFALACKISAIYFIPIIALFLIFKYYQKVHYLFLVSSLLLLFVSFIVFRIFQPYSFIGLFKLNPVFVNNIKELQLISAPNGNFPPAVQWLSKTRFLFPYQNIFIWGLGLPLSLSFLFFLFYRFKKIFISKYPFLIFIWIVLLLAYQGSTYTPTLRYFLPIYPFITILFVYLFSFGYKYIVLSLIISFHFIYGLAFINIYSHLHPRVDASVWMYQNLSAGSTLTNEYWDDPLPLGLPNSNPAMFSGIMVSPYDPDSEVKIDKLMSEINSANYIIMSSNRLWGSIPLVPNLYPFTSKYYQDLFSNKLNFRKVLELNSYPGFPLPFMNSCYYFGPSNYPGIQNNFFDTDDQCLNPGIYLRDDTAEEAFTVYDHPKVLIFSRNN